MHMEAKKWEREDYRWLAITSQRGAFANKPGSLRPVLTPTMDVILADHMAIDLHTDEPQDGGILNIYYQIHAVDYPTQMEKINWQDLMNNKPL